MSGQTLTIPMPRLSHAGIYECTNGKSLASIEIEIVELPKITLRYPGNIIKPKIPVVISCHAEGYPIPNVKIFKVNDDLDVSYYKSESEISIPFMGADEEGEYRCIAENSVGTVQETISIAIKTPWINPPYQEVFSGSSVLLECSAAGNITWLWPDGSTIPISYERFVMSDNFLNIKQAFKSDTGEYSCQSGSESDTAMVIVKSLPAQFLQTPLSMAKIPIPSSWYDKIDLQFKFRTLDSQGTILYAPGSNGVDYFKVYLEDGYILAEWNLGSGIGLIRAGAVVVGEFYNVVIERVENRGTIILKSDSNEKILATHSARSPGAFTGTE